MPRIRAASIDEHKAMTRRALLDSARELISEAGTVSVPLGDIAVSAGIGRTTFYDYFTDRDDVVAALVEEELPQVLSEMIESVDATRPIPERLGELISRMVEFVATDPVFGVILHQEVGRLGEEAQERIKESHAQLSREMADLYRSGVAEGLFTPLTPGLAGILIQDTIMSGAKLLIADRFEGQRLEEVVSGVRDFLLAGLGSRR